MANYSASRTIQVNKSASGQWTVLLELNETLSLADFPTCKITGVSFSIKYGGGNSWTNLYYIKIGNQQIDINKTKTSSYSVSGLAVEGASDIVINGSAASTQEAAYVYVNTISVTVYYSADESSTTVAPLSGSEIRKSASTEFSWTNVVPSGTISSQTLYWKNGSASSYTAISLDASATSYTFPANTFTDSTMNWYVSFTDSSGNTATSGIETVNVGITPHVTLSYPVECNMRIANQQIFTWEMTESAETGQASYSIKYKKEDESDYTTVTETSSNQYHTFAENTFTSGNYTYGVQVTNNDGMSSEWVYSSFVAIGTTTAPDITSVTNSAIPTITWTVTSQDTFEMEIYQGATRLYTSGVQVGSDVRTFTPEIMLADGSYSIKMRAMNEYGYFTEWIDYSFILSSTKPAALTCYAYANDYHGVTIAQSLGFSNELTTSATTGTVPSAIYVLRRLYGETDWNIIGKLSTTDSTVKYDDNTVITGVKYEYALRNYLEDAGYTDSDVVSIIIEHVGSLIYCGNDFVELYETEDEQFDIKYTPSKQYSYSYTIGRKYPVRESSEWMSQSIEISCFVTIEQYEMLEDFYEGNDDCWFKGDNFSFQCAIDSLDIKETLWGKGYTLGITLSRTDEEEVELF